MKFCCDQMKTQVEHKCEKHKRCPDQIMIKTNNGFGIPIQDGGDSYMSVNYCPWCSCKIEKEIAVKQEVVNGKNYRKIVIEAYKGLYEQILI